MVLHNVMLLVVGLLISILLQGATPALILSKPYTVIVMLVPTVAITLHACVYCYISVCSYMYMNVILLVILYQVSFLYCFYCTFVLLSQEWLNKDVQSILAYGVWWCMKWVSITSQTPINHTHYFSTKLRLPPAMISSIIFIILNTTAPIETELF